MSRRVCALRPVCILRVLPHEKSSPRPFLQQPAGPPCTASNASRWSSAHARCRQRRTLHPTLQPSVKTGDLMARTKYIPTPRSQHKAAPKPRPQTVQRATWTAAIELGASNGQAMVKKLGGEWELVRWAQGVSASSVGGAEAIPAMTAIRKKGEVREILHGHAAVRARKRNPGDWEMFAYPKLVFTDEGTTPDVQRTLDLQKEKARALGITSKEIAIAFFRHMISEVIGGRDEVFKIYMNISDRWPNRNVQELMLNLKSVRTDAQFEHVDECLSSIIGRISSDTGSASAEGVYVVIDCGHSGMVCFQPLNS
jgi:hypothetical protein